MTEQSTETPVAQNVTDTPSGILIGADPRPTPTFTPVLGTNTTNGNTATIFTAEQIQKARQEEKDKLYPELQSMKAELAELKKERDTKIEAETKARKAAEAAAEEARKADTDTRTLLEEQEARFQAELARRDAEAEQQRQILDLERQYQELQNYRSAAMDAARDDIVPELLDLITGSTREEIDASIDGLKARSTRIVEQMQAATQAARAGMRGAPVTAPPAGPMDTYSGHDPILEAANNGSLSFEDYVKNRDKLLSSAARSRSGGLYG